MVVYAKLGCCSITRNNIIIPKNIQRYSIGEDTLSIKAKYGDIAVVSKITHRYNLLRKVKPYTNSTRAMMEYIDLVFGKRLSLEVLVDKDTIPLAIRELLTQEVEVRIVLL
jgi:hypothetical protein